MQADDLLELRDIAALDQALVDARADLRLATDELRIFRARIEKMAIDEAGGEKKFGTSAEARTRNLLLVVSDDPQYREYQRRLSIREAKANNLQVRYDTAIRSLRREEWLTRQGLIDALNALATRPCYVRLDHTLTNTVADLTGECGVYAGESDYVANESVS